MKKLLIIISTIAFLLSFTACATDQKKNEPESAPETETPAEETAIIRFDSSKAVVDTGSKEFSGITVMEAVKDMTAGWNLGNTLDATGSGNSVNSEMSWGQPKTTQKMIKDLAASGIKTIRIPISWANHMDKKDYTVNPAWMTRVKEIVDWAIEEDMYVIINAHHDNGESAAKLNQACGYYPNTTNYAESERFLVNVWTQVSLAFNNGYDEHLVFETMNEPRLKNTANEWWFDANNEKCQDAAESLNKLNQACVDAIRATGGNNQKRFISVPGLQASPDSALAGAFHMPQDDEPGKIILSVHMYTPYSFAMESPGAVHYTAAHKAELTKMFSRLNANFVEKGYPVIVGEYGATNKDNLEDRVNWFTDFITISRQYGMTCCLWDNGVWELNGKDYSEHYGFYNRLEGTWYFPEILDAIISSAK